MKRLLLILLLFMPLIGSAQKDTTITIKVSARQEFPQIGLDSKGKKYFVMSIRQDKAAITVLQQSLYADSILAEYEELRENCEKEIKMLNGRINDRGLTISAQNRTIAELEQNYHDERSKNENNTIVIDALNKQVKKQKIPMWAGVGLSVLGGLLILDAATDD